MAGRSGSVLALLVVCLALTACTGSGGTAAAPPSPSPAPTTWLSAPFNPAVAPPAHPEPAAKLQAYLNDARFGDQPWFGAWLVLDVQPGDQATLVTNGADPGFPTEQAVCRAVADWARAADGGAPYQVTGVSMYPWHDFLGLRMLSLAKGCVPLF